MKHTLGRTIARAVPYILAWSAMTASVTASSFTVSGAGGSIPDATGTSTWNASYGGTPFTSTVTVVNPVTCITKVVLSGLTHTWRGDLHILLRNPAGTEFNLVVRPGSNGTSVGDSGDYLVGDYEFVDSGGSSVAQGATNITGGTYDTFLNSGSGQWTVGGAVNGPLSSITGGAGTWTLEIRDWAVGDTGSLSGWTLSGLDNVPNPTVTLLSSGPIVPNTTVTLTAQLPVSVGYEDNGNQYTARLLSASFDIVTPPLVAGVTYQPFTITAAQASFAPVSFFGVTVPGATIALAQPGEGRIEYSRGVIVAQLVVIASIPGYPSIRALTYTTGRLLSSTTVQLLMDGDSVELAAPSAQSFCDAGVGGVIACPCSNPPAGSPRGCDNSSATGGAIIAAAGFPSLASDTLVFTTSDEKPTATTILLQGTAQVPAGAAFGQGIRCVGGTLKRLYTKSASGGSITAPFGGDPTVSARSAALGDTISPGAHRYYMAYYRDPIILGGCGGAATFNATGGSDVIWN